jgi:SAM-dependent methyltransferase
MPSWPEGTLLAMPMGQDDEKRSPVELGEVDAGAGATMASKYDADYFAHVYGRSSNGHDAAQTVLDRFRDARISDAMRRYTPTGPGRRPALLDVGCGYGWILDRLRGSFDLYAMDVSPHALARTAGRVRDAAVALADVEDGIPFSRRFDAVLAVNVLEHMRDPAAAVTAIHDALIPGGVAVVHLPTIDNAVSRIIYWMTYARDHTHVYRPSAKAVRTLFASAGFALVNDSHSPHVPRAVWNMVPWHPAYLAVFRRTLTSQRDGHD